MLCFSCFSKRFFRIEKALLLAFSNVKSCAISE
nr:MAG TPA: hypothetical protein [Caudoviricetes sp.]